jgi:hypothetical protein
MLFARLFIHNDLMLSKIIQFVVLLVPAGWLPPRWPNHWRQPHHRDEQKRSSVRAVGPTAVFIRGYGRSLRAAYWEISHA